MSSRTPSLRTRTLSSLTVTDERLHGLKEFASKLTGAAVLRLEGADTEKFLQDKTTNDVTKLEGGEAQYSAWLNRKGRFLHSSILIKDPNGQSFFLVCERNSVQALSKHIKLFKFRSDVSLTDITEQVDIWSFVSKNEKSLSDVIEKNEKDGELSVIDPRGSTGEGGTPPLGAVLMMPKDQKPVLDDVEILDEDAFDTYRILHGIPRDTYDIFTSESFILEANFDRLNGVSFTKGCYLGQELTARSHHTGVIRKRLMPVVLTESAGDAAAASPIGHFERTPHSDFLFPSFVKLDPGFCAPSGGAPITMGKKTVGKLYSSRHGVAIAQIRQEVAKSTTALECEGFRITPFLPEWWPEVGTEIDSEN